MQKAMEVVVDFARFSGFWMFSMGSVEFWCISVSERFGGIFMHRSVQRTMEKLDELNER